MNIYLSTTNESRRAFSLMELLIVISIILLMAALVFPVVSSMQRSARSVQCVGNLRQFGIAVQNYANDNDGFLVSGANMSQYWMQFLFPYLMGTKAVADYGNELPPIAWCPEWFISDPLGKTQNKSNAWRIGYSMNIQPGFDASNPSVSTVTNNRWYGDANTNSRDNSWTGDFRLSDITYKPTRALIIDGKEWQTDTSYSFTAFDRHGKDKSNVLFFDYHVESQNSAYIKKAIKDPASLAQSSKTQ